MQIDDTPVVTRFSLLLYDYLLSSGSLSTPFCTYDDLDYITDPRRG
jgi:hypothetical protein